MSVSVQILLISKLKSTRSIIPPPPLHLFGRDEYVRRIVDLITSKVSARLGARLVIGGPGGIGKTSVALKIFHLPELDALIPPQARFFVRCQAVTTASTFLSAIASTLGVEMAEDNPLESVLRRLRAERGPMMLVLDNAESFWMNSEVQPHARAILRHACNIVPLTLLITIRGTEQPDVAIWDPLPLLGPLRLDDARKAFFAIANTVQPSASLDLLLKKVDYVPLAVNLLARRCQISGENPIALSNRWERERTELLQLGGRSPEDNIDISIKLSLDLELMQKNPVALRLLSIVSHLPAGIPDEACNSLELPEPELSAAEFLLRRLSLTYSPAPGWLTTLEPVRAYVRRWHHPSPDHLRAVEDWHIALATSHGNYEPGDAEFQSASATLALHSANISFVLHARIRRRDNLPYLANAVLAFSNFLSCTLPDADLLASLLSVGGDELDGLPHSQCTQLLGNILLTRGEYEEAQLKLEEARSQYINIHDPLAAAQCLSSLGDIARMRDQYNDARSKLEEAQEIFTNIGDRVGIAQCLRGLGHTLLMQGWYVEAQLKLKEAHLEFINIGDPLGAAQCLQCLGDVSLTLCQYKDARSKLEEAHLAFIGLNNWNGAAQCLQSLSDLSFREGHYKDARSKLDEAHSKFVSVGSRHWAAQCLQSLGTLLCAQCQFGPARAKLKEALMEFRSTNAQLGQAKCLQSLGNLLLLQGRYGEARSGLEEAQSKFTEVGDRHGVAQCRRSLANILKAERPHDEAARAKLEEVRVEFINLGDRLGITECLRCLGDISLTQGRYDDARSKLEEALSHFSSIGYRLGVAQCLRGLGDVFRLQGHHADARSTLEDARSIFISLEDQLGTARCLRSLSIVLQAQGHCEDARSMLEDAKSRFISIGLRAEAAGTDRILCRDVTPRPYVNT